MSVFKGFWVCMIALVLAALFVVVFYLALHVQDYQIVQTNERMEAAKHQDDQVDKYLEACTGNKHETLSITFNCVTKRQKEDRQTKTSHYDLKAQQEMAVWAYIIVWLTGGGVLFSALGFIALVVDIRVARNNGMAQSRAYINITDSEEIRVVVGQPINLRIAMVNSGQTPARNVAYAARPHTTLTKKIGDIGTPDLNVLKAGADLAPGATAWMTNTTYDFDLGQNDIDLINNGVVSLVFVYYIKYRDVFGRDHFTKTFLGAERIHQSDSYRLAHLGEGNEST